MNFSRDENNKNQDILKEFYVHEKRLKKLQYSLFAK